MMNGPVNAGPYTQIHKHTHTHTHTRTYTHTNTHTYTYTYTHTHVGTHTHIRTHIDGAGAEITEITSSKPDETSQNNSARAKNGSKNISHPKGPLSKKQKI
jgi:hypothetical protein